MTTKRQTWLGVALLCVALGGASGAEKKKSGDAAAMAEAARGVQLAQQGDAAGAILAFTNAIEASPKDARLYNDRGGLYLTTLKFTEAAADFTKAVELAPTEYAGYSSRGAALVELNQLDAAMADLNKALELKPDDPRTLERRGLAYYKQKNYEASLADYNKALEIHAKNAPSPTPGTEAAGAAETSPVPDATPRPNPASAMALSRRADTYVAMNQLAAAQADLQAYLKMRPEDFNAEERLRFVNAKLNPAPVVAAVPTPTPTPPPMKLLTRANVFIALGALLALGIIVVLIAKMAMTRGSD